MKYRDENVGKFLLALDFTGTGCSPAIKAIMSPDTNAEEVAKAISAGFLAALNKHLGKNWSTSLPTTDVIGVSVRSCSGIILPTAEQAAIYKKQWDDLREMFTPSEAQVAAKEKAIDEHPMNGKLGWWRVHGVRNSCYVKASSCREALDKSSECVGDWESPSAEWVGELPEVIEC